MDFRRPATLLLLSGPACCVAASARVRTPRGEVPAGALIVGDSVRSLDLATGRPVDGTIVAIRRARRECLMLRWSGGELVCTPDHPLYAPETTTYRPAADWITGYATRLLVFRDDTPESVELLAAETFAGIHDVVDLTLAAEPRNFVADGVLVHNKSIALPPGDPLEFVSVDAEGPSFVLEAPGETRRYHLRVCLDGEDFPAGNLDLTIDATTTAQLGADEFLWLSYQLDLDKAPTAETVPGTLGGYVLLPDDPCTGGVVFTFRHVQGPEAAEIAVAWTLAISTDHDIDTPEGTLDVSIDPVE